MVEDSKKTWETPKLTTYGKIEDITKQTIKHIGLNDGFMLSTDQGPVSIGELGS